MGAETDLSKLLANMEPKLQEGDYVFCCVSSESFKDLEVEPRGWFWEAEGITLILEREVAERAGLKFQGLWRMITLQVHSSLQAVGLLAAVTTKLASVGVSVNPVSAYYHDHLFVPAEKGELALKLLVELMGEARKQASVGR